MSPLLVALAAALSLQPATARACSRDELPPKLMGQPADRDREVPTNVVLRYALPSQTARFDDPPDLVPGAYVLRAASGEEVPLDVTRPVTSQLELVPKQALKPKTSYTLSARWKLPMYEAEGQLSFETGDGPLDETPEPPQAVMRSYQLQQDHSASCGPYRMGSCVSVENDKQLFEYTHVDEKSGQRSAPALVRGSSWAGYSSRSNCVDVRRFSPNGTRSEPLRLCTEDAPIVDLMFLEDMPSVSCSAGGLAWSDASGELGVEPEEDGPRCIDGGALCTVESNTGSTASGQGMALNSGAAGASAMAAPRSTPAAEGCNAVNIAPGSRNAFGMLAWLSGLTLLVVRRRIAR